MNNELIREAQKFLKKKGIKLSREQVYQKLVKGGFIDEFGNPTPRALENGLISQVVTYPQGMPDQGERDIQNVFSRMPSEAFNYSDNPNLSSIQTKPLKKAIKEALQDGSLSKQGQIKWTKTLRKIERNY